MSDERGHRYPYPDGTSDCAWGCGCWMGPFNSGGPEGVDPFGECPKAPAPPPAVDPIAAAEARGAAAERERVRKLAEEMIAEEWKKGDAAPMVQRVATYDQRAILLREFLARLEGA